MAALLSNGAANRNLGGKSKMQLQRRLTALFLVALLLAGAGLSGAATIYVRTDGNDANTGQTDTPAGAKATFLGAMLAATGGDVIQFAPGTYDDAGSVRTVFASDLTFRSASPANRAVLRSMGVRLAATAVGTVFENLVLDNNFSHREAFVIEYGISNVTLRNVEFRNPSLTTDALEDRRGLVMVQGCNGLLVENCQFVIQANTLIPVYTFCLGNLRDHLFFGFTSSNWTVRDSNFLVIPDPAYPTNVNGGGITFNESIANVLIEGCTFETVSECVRVETTLDTDAPRFFPNFVFRDNGIRDSLWDDGLWFGSNNVYTDLVIENNLIAAVEDSGVWMEGGGTAVLDGCTIVGNVMLDVGYQDQGTDNAIRMDDLLINPTPGKKVSILNNVFTRPNVGADEGLWINLKGSGLEIAGNVFSNYQSFAMLIDGSEKNVGEGALEGALINGNVILNSNDTAVLLRTNSEPVHNVLIEANDFRNSTPWTIHVRHAAATGTVVRLNTFRDNAVAVRSAAPVVVTRNDVFGSTSVTAAGLYFDTSVAGAGVTSDISGSVISYNVLASNRNYAILLSANLAATSTNVRVFNNTVVGNITNGILVGLNNSHVYNNIIALHTGTGLNFQGTTPGAIGYNLLYNQLVGGTNYAGFAATPLPGDLSADPRFVDAPNRDYRLQANSPAIGAGAAQVGGNLLADGSDMGAYPTQTLSTAVRVSGWELYR